MGVRGLIGLFMYLQNGGTLGPENHMENLHPKIKEKLQDYLL